MNTTMKSERPVLRSLFVIICLFIPFVLTNAVLSLVRKVTNAFAQRELKFNGTTEDSTPADHRTDPIATANIKGEETVQSVLCAQRTSQTVGSRCHKSTTQQTNNKNFYKGKKNTKTSKKRNKRKIKIQPPPVEELILRSSIADCTTENVKQRLTEVPQQELPGINVANTVENT